MGDPKATMDEAAFDALETEFKDVIDQLKADPELEKFRVEYEKLHSALKSSHESEKRLMGKCRELNAELVTNTAKVESMMRSNFQDESATASLQKEIEQAWKLVDASRENEERLKGTITQLKEEITQMQDTVDEGPRHVAPEEDITLLIKQKKEMATERDTLIDQVVHLRDQVADLTTLQQRTEEEKQKKEQDLTLTKEEIAKLKTDAEREMRTKSNLERQLNTLKQDLDAKTQEIYGNQKKLEDAQAEVNEIEVKLQKGKAEIDILKSDQEALVMKNRKLEKEVEGSMLSNQGAFEANAKLKQNLKEKEEEVASLKQEASKQEKLMDSVTKKLKASEEKRIEVQSKKDSLASDVSALEKELEASRRQVEQDRKQLDDLARQRDVITKKMMHAGKETEVQEALVKMHESTKKNLENEIAAHKSECEKQRKICSQLEKERDRYLNEVTTTQQKCVQALEDVKLMENQNFDLKKKIVEAENKLKQQQNLYEAVRSDRNLYSKNLIESQDEISEMKRKLKIINHQIEQLKEEITSKENALLKEHQAHEEVEQQKIKLKSELDKLKSSAVKQSKAIQAQKTEEEKLRKILVDADIEKQKQQKELEAVISERDTLSSQLIRRNDELSLVYEKIRIQQSTLSKGETQYAQRVEDIRLLKVELKQLRREKTILSKSASNVDELQRELFRVHRELTKEKMRCKGLEDELETPMNVHRWRQLEGSDPETFEMIQKVQALQKRLIQKTEEVVEKELLIQEKEKQYLELKNVLARQPGPEVAEQLQIYQQTLKEKNKQLKSMASELNMYQAQSAEYKYEIERLAREQQETKKKYFDFKKREQLAKERERTLQPLSASLGASASTQRFAGGGFKLNKSTNSRTATQPVFP